MLQQRMAEPLHHGVLDGASGKGAVGNPACGDIVTVYVRMEHGAVMDATFTSMGSPFQLATASVLCDVARGMTPDDIAAMSARPVVDRLDGLPREKYHLARLAVDALQLAVTNATQTSP